MKKVLLALIVSIISLTVLLGMTANAADEPVEKFSWFDEYEASELKVLYLRGNRDNPGEPHGAVDVIFGDDFVWVSAEDQYFTPTTERESIRYGSYGVIYHNDTEEPWEVSSTFETSKGRLYFNSDGVISRYENTYFTTEFEGAEAETYYSFWWNADTGQREHVARTFNTNEMIDHRQLTYGDLDEYIGLSKTDIDAKKVEGITFKDDDLIYIKDNKYTTEVTEEKLMNTFRGFVLQPGEYVLAFRYLDKTAHAATLKTIPEYIDGTSKIQVKQHDIAAPTISVDAPEVLQVSVGSAFDLPTATAKDTGLPLVSDDTTNPEVTTKVYKFDLETEEFVLLDEAKIDTSVIGNLFKVELSATDVVGNKTVRTYEVQVIADFAPVITGVENLTMELGETIDFAANVRADDGYGKDVTDQLRVISFVDNTRPGSYIVMYEVINGYNLRAIEYAKVDVLDTEAPNAYPVGDVTIVEGTDFDLTSPVLAYDNYDRPDQLTLTVVDDGGFDKAKAGTYEIKVRIQDSGTNRKEVTYKLTVISKVNPLQPDVDQLNADLEAADKMIDDLESKDTQLMIFSIIAGVFGLAGIGLALPSILKKH